MRFINKYLRNLAPYKVASHKVWEVDKAERKLMLKLDWNEATIPPSPNVKKRLVQLAEQEDMFSLYPSTNNVELVNLLSSYCGVPAENIQYFASSDALHEYLVRMFVSVGDPILILGPTYDNFRLTCESQGAKIYYFEYSTGFVLDERKFIDSIKHTNPSLIYICNPNNPTGNLVSKNFIEEILINFPNSLLLLDEAYYEFSGMTLANEVLKYDNLFISRTFSKAFALANFRAGYLISNSENIKQISKIRNPKNFTTFTQEAVIGALEDVQYMHDFVSEVKLSKEYFTHELSSISGVVHIYQSHGNFVLIEFESSEIKELIFKGLADNFIYVRNLTHNEMLSNSLRITIGTQEQMKHVVNIINSIVGK